MGFNQTLEMGKVGESRIAQWLRQRGNNILPVYEIEKEQFKGPAVYTCDWRELIAPDILAFKKDQVIWIEAKHKTAFTWHRITNRWVTGIDLHHYKQYQEVAKLVDWPVWLLFLHQGGQAKDSPAKSPSGLYGGSLKYLMAHENHTHNNHGKSGMVYWAIENPEKQIYGVKKIANL